MTSRQYAALFANSRFGSFRATAAVRPMPGTPTPRTGYRADVYRNPKTGVCIPALAAVVSGERLLEVFFALLEPLGDVVEVVLATSHRGPRHRELRRRHIDRPVLESHLWEFEDLLLDDGCTGLAVISAAGPMEVQFDEHKLLICYARDRRPFRQILTRFGVRRRDSLNLVCENPHVHNSSPAYLRQFRELAQRLGAGRPVGARPV